MSAAVVGLVAAAGGWRGDALCAEIPDFCELPDHAQVRTCWGCPVSTECLFDALEVEERSWMGSAGHVATVRGGLTAAQRVRILRHRRDVAAREAGSCL